MAAAWPILLVELAYAQMARAPRLELGRIRSAMLSGFGLAGALVFAFSFAYVASERDKKVDLAYFRTSRPGEVTRRIVRNLDQPIEVAVFFPAANEVRDEVDDYLDDLAKESRQLKVTHYDFDIDPIKAKEYGVTTNGILVFVRGARKEQLGPPDGDRGARNGAQDVGQGGPAAPDHGGEAAAHGGVHASATASGPGSAASRQRQARRHHDCCATG